MSSTRDPLVVCPFRIVVDTREQFPYDFSRIPPRGKDGGKFLTIPTVRSGLESGDYSIEGFEGRVAIERKSLEDLYSTLGDGRERFEREFERLSTYDFAAVVIEANIQEIWRPEETRGSTWRSRLNPKSVEGTIVAWSVRYPRVHWWPMGTRRASEIRTFWALERFWEERQE